MSEVFAYITAKDQDQALRLARALLERRLVACVNLLPGVRSLYWWKGELCEESEVVLVAKTREQLCGQVSALVREIHSYEVPCVVFMPIIDGNPDFLAWINQETAAS